MKYLYATVFVLMTTTVYAFSGGTVNWTVPHNVNSIEIQEVAADGRQIFKQVVPVSAGQKFTIRVVN